MRMSQELEKAFNDQINMELSAFYTYLSMSAFFENEGLTGFARWMRHHASEEMAHAMKIYDYVNERRGRVTLAAIGAPPSDWTAPMAVFEDALRHEQKVTASINRLVDLAREERDLAAMVTAVQRNVAENVGGGVTKQLPGGRLVFDDAFESFRRCIRNGAQTREILLRKCGSRLERLVSAVFITPHDHFWHHSADNPHCNFGTVFSMWDRLHGTYHSPERLPSAFGTRLDMPVWRQLLFPF